MAESSTHAARVEPVVVVEDSVMMDDSHIPLDDTTAYESTSLMGDKSAADLLMEDKPDETCMAVDIVKVEAAAVEGENTPPAAKKPRKDKPFGSYIEVVTKTKEATVEGASKLTRVESRTMRSYYALHEVARRLRSHGPR